MIDYSEKSSSIAQKFTLIFLQILAIWLSYQILFGGLADPLLMRLGRFITGGNHFRKAVLLTFNLMLFVSYLPTFLIFVKRKISWLEAVNIAIAFSLYYLGFALLGYNRAQLPNWIDLLGIAMFTVGISLHLAAEWQRFSFKKHNPNKLLTQGLWKLSRHINYFADLLWVSGYALVTRNPWSGLIVLLLFAFFYWINIPLQEKHLEQQYGQEFIRYKNRTKALIPWLL